jgi:REP element-mobilizing transposase RayT
MARRPRIFAPGLLYHVIVRGNQRRTTFRSDDDYQAYLERLAIYRAKFSLRIYAYCLMPNHVHLLVESGSTPLAKFMQGLQQSYTQYFNRRYRKVGHLFQGRYKAIICDRDKYLLALVRYIHLNPVRAGLSKRPERYGYSGHRSYLNSAAAKIVEAGPILRLLGGRGHEKFVLEGMEEDQTTNTMPWKISAFGEEGFGGISREPGRRRAQSKQPLEVAFRRLPGDCE